MVALQATRDDSDRSGEVVSHAVVRAAEFLGLKGGDTAKLLNISQSSFTRMKSGSFTLASDSKEFELALLLLRLYKELYVFGAGDQDFCRKWMVVENRVLQASPIDVIRKIEGLVDVVRYLECANNKV